MRRKEEHSKAHLRTNFIETPRLPGFEHSVPPTRIRQETAKQRSRRIRRLDRIRVAGLSAGREGGAIIQMDYARRWLTKRIPRLARHSGQARNDEIEASLFGAQGLRWFGGGRGASGKHAGKQGSECQSENGDQKNGDVEAFNFA